MGGAKRYPSIASYEDDGFRRLNSSYIPPLQQGLVEVRAIAVIKTDLADVYRDYIACLNRQDWPKLGQFVDDDVIHNGRRVGLSGYREMLERDFDEIPDLHFNIQMLISDPPYIASRLDFDCTPKGTFLGLHVNGRRVCFAENVIYEFRSEKIAQVWSVIDKAAIEAQL
jgi:predicted ester cyclase